jgi:hypothetical protein
MISMDAPNAPERNRRLSPTLARTEEEAWNLVIVFLSTVAAVLIPAHLLGGSELVPAYEPIEWFITVVFAGDFFFRYRRSQMLGMRGGKGMLFLDFLAALPFHLTAFPPILTLLRLVKLGRVGQLLSSWRLQRVQWWNVLRLVYFVYWLGLCVHWITLGWIAIRGIPIFADVPSLYLHSLYWCLSTLTTIGYGDITPRTNTEIGYVIGIMIFGVATYGYVIGNVANILVNIDPARAGYFDRMEKLSSFMNYRGIPPELQRRVREYHTYVWEHRLGYDEVNILSGLPPALMTEVSMFLKREVIQNVPFFATASDQLLKDIALAMHPVVYMPGDIVMEKGEVGRAMFFISRGEVEVLDDERERIALLGKGDAFGEMALVLDRPRGATVRALGYCDLYRLEKYDFDDILKRYPEFSTHIRQLAKLRRDWKIGKRV